MAGRAFGIIMAAFIALVAVYAFYPRSLPDFPATATNPSRLRINGLAQTGDRLVAVGESGHVLISDDGAKSWRDGTVLAGAGIARVDSTLTNIRFLDRDLGFVVGHDGLILRSTDEGASWTPVRFDDKYSDPLFDLCRSSTGTIVVVGSFGRLLTSTDKGDSFEQVDLDATLPDGPHLNDVACAGEGHVMAVGEFAQALRSRDGGATWEALQLPYNGSLYGVIQATNERWIAFGMLGHIFTTDDFGDSWTEVKPGIETSLFGGLKLADGRVVLYGQGNTILVSTNAGSTFRIEREGGRESLITALELSPDRLLFGGEKGISEVTLGRPVAALVGGQ